MPRHGRSDGRGAPGRCFETGVAQPAQDVRTEQASAVFEGFTRTEIKTSGARIVTVHGGKGPPLLLMHGNPFSHVSWHKVAPRLAQRVHRGRHRSARLRRF